MKYRPDIDGLRSLAIIPVILYHYGVSALPGGFVGVDVFFVISGYLITGIVAKDISSRSFSLVTFYERRARRILPALFFMLAVVTALAAFVLTPGDMANFGRSLVATVLFVSNVFFWLNSGYFDPAAELQPLLHTWSLAVEEQFYLLFPPALFLLSTWLRRWVNPLLLLVVALSFAISVWSSQTHPVAGFYLPITRAWELLFGALIALGTVPAMSGRRVRDVLSILGLVLIVGAILLIDESMPFPGWLALFPCLGAGLIIYAGQQGGGFGNALLSLRPLPFVGKISYALYLWHWPLIVLARMFAARDLTLLETTGILALCVGLSIFSLYYVERPFRHAPGAFFSRKRIFLLSGGATLAVAAAGAALVATGGLPQRFSPEVLRYANFPKTEKTFQLNCFNRTAASIRAEGLCPLGDIAETPPSFVIWGDSHAHRFAEVVSRAASAQGRTGLLASVGSCPPLIGVGSTLPDCEPFNKEVVRQIEANDLRYVVLSGLWARYAEGSEYSRDGADYLRDAESGSRSLADSRLTFTRSLKRTVAYFTGQGRRVIVIGPVPEIDVPVPDALARAEMRHGNKDFGPSRAAFEARQKVPLEALAEISKMPGVTVIYPSAMLCGATCAVEADRTPLYVDENHLSLFALRRLQPLFEGMFGDARTASAPLPQGRGSGHIPATH